MTDPTPSPTTAAPTPTRPAPKARRSKAADAVTVRAKTTLAALPALLPGIAAKDKDAAKVRIDEAWVTGYANAIATAEQAEGASAVATVDQKAATALERQQGLQLSLLLTDVRDRVATQATGDLQAQEAYGRGTKIDPRRTSVLTSVAGSFLAAWDGKWKQPAVDAGVTQATMGQIQKLRDSLSAANVAQRSTVQTNAKGTLTRAAAIAVVTQMTAYAVKVVTNVFGRGSDEVATLSDPRPVTNRASSVKATKKKRAAVKAAAKAKKAARLAKPGKRAAAVKGRAKRAAVATKAKALAASLKPAAKVAKAKGAKAKSAVKKAKKRG